MQLGDYFCVLGWIAALEALGFEKMDFNSDNRFAPQQNISCKMNIMTEIFGLGASKAGIHPRTLISFKAVHFGGMYFVQTKHAVPT